MDVAAGAVASASADVDLLVQFAQEGFLIHFAAPFAEHAGAARGGGGFPEQFGDERPLLVVGDLDLGEVGPQAGGHSRGSGDQMGIVLVLDEGALGVHPEHRQHPAQVRFVDDAGRFAQHRMLVLAPQIDGVAHPADIQAAAVAEADYILDVEPLLAVGVLGVVGDQIGLGVELDEVGNVLVVPGVTADQPELGREDPDLRRFGDTEEMLGVVVLPGDVGAVEVVVEVLDFLIPGEKHQPPASVGGLLEIFEKALFHLFRHIGGKEVSNVFFDHFLLLQFFRTYRITLH